MTKEIHAKATAGIYSEVMKQVYDSLDKRIREAVSNAIDARASSVKISVFISHDSKFIIYDNGNGMSSEDLVDKYVTMGGGENYGNENTIGRIGIGALSIFAVGERITIRTRKKGTANILTAELSFSELQKENNHSMPLEKIILGNITAERTANSNEEEHFTEITISDLSKQVLEIFSDADKTKELIEKLERILPVPLRDDDVIFERLSSTELQEGLISQKFVLKDLTLHIPHLGYSNPDYKIFRKSIESVDNAKIIQYYPIYPFNIGGGSRTDFKVFGYLYINDGRVLPKNWQGVNARVKNVTVESNTYFGFEDDPASRNRIGGELFIVDIDENHAITTNRSGFAVENHDYQLVQEYMEQCFKEVMEIVRKHSMVDSLVKKYVAILDSVRKAFENNATIQDSREDNISFKELDDQNISLTKENSYSLKDSIKSELDKKKTTFELLWSNVIPSNYQIVPEEGHHYTIYVHGRLQKFIYNVSGNSIEYVIAYCGERNPLLIKKFGKVYVNLDNKLIPNKDVTKLDVGFVKAVLALYLNYLRCNGDAEKLYSNTVDDLVNI